MARRHPEVAGFDAGLLVVTDADVFPRLVDAIARLVSAVNDGSAIDLDGLVDELVIAPEVTAPLVDAVRRAADFRSRVLRDFGSFGAAEVADLAAGAGGRVRSAGIARRWRAEGKIFAVPVRGNLRHLAFQFDEHGQPLAGVADVLSVIGAWPPWQIATWFVTAHPMLDHQQPATLLRDRPATVVAAARHDARLATRRVAARP
jgi:hypothetical protein